ncbi:MAG: hypothetical protein IIT81_01925, partial [Mycoplasmataceae bacterium]|nr:hypothetical protein [Mycoplasmataceae bacterium]
MISEAVYVTPFIVNPVGNLLLISFTIWERIVGNYRGCYEFGISKNRDQLRIALKELDYCVSIEKVSITTHRATPSAP